MTTLRKSVIAIALCTLAASGSAWAQSAATDTSTYKPTVGQAGKDVVWVPTAQTLVDRILDMAKLTPEDKLVDLGSGDGRTVITAAKRGATARGIEFNPDMVAISKRAAAAEGVTARATFEQADIFQSDFSNATVVTLFLLPDLNVRLRPTLLAMKPGTRVVSNSFMMGDWQPDESSQVKEDCTNYCNAYKWIVPAQIEGAWKLGDKDVSFDQRYQKFEGSLRQGGQATPITEGSLDGTRIAFTAGSDKYAGEVNGNQIKGTINGQTAWTATRAAR
ncbi:class I SAM-dependent methyltransferase [Pigmentiphaga aceris]|uniref:Class I SAM-dependent methyltransferase n=1 Tax=Pigmentiphaga aceris TaxID=1940612 RepID=A0A5C0B0E3_9BURK|nr:class I SAM-dependent methyltransferase [Pigmentiphaga aceris]QEI07845.1 class I SAM-dependent methyltransferase [Pigmentiphaga aceris]